MSAEKYITHFNNMHRRPAFKKVSEGSKLFVLAPHPDDEIIGPGGLLIKHAQLGNPIHIVFITNGAKGRSREQSAEEIIAIRMDEATQVCHQLGATYSFLGCPDGSYLPERTGITLLMQLIDECQPTDILLPHPRDSHRDHFMTNLLFYQTICESGEKGRNIWEYEVWSPLVPNAVINISDEMQQKRQLMAIYESQLQLIHYDQMMEGLNKYRVSTIPIPGITHMEAFYCSSETAYMKKMNGLLLDMEDE